MKVTNETNYDTKYLRKLFLECEKHSFEIFLQHSNPKHRTVKVVYHRTGWIGGCAWIGGNTITLKLPRKYTSYSRRNTPSWVNMEMKEQIEYYNKIREEEIELLPAREVASVYLHELAHNLGKHHKDMINGGHTRYKVNWWPDEPVPLKAVKEKPKQNIIELRATNAQKKLDRWKSKATHASRMIKKYQQKVKYYEKKMAAMNICGG